MLKEQLEKFGLSEKEAKTYITLLELGESGVTEISNASGVNRSSAYVVLEALKKKGLVTAAGAEPKQTFKAAPPEKLAQIAEERLRETQSIHQNVLSILPHLKSVDANSRAPEIRIYDGKEGLIEAFENSLSVDEKVMRVFSSVSQLSKVLPKTYFPGYVRRRISKGVKMRGIHPKTKFTTLMKKLVPESISEVTVIPKANFDRSVDIAIFDDKVSYMTDAHGGYSVEIRDQRLADSMKRIFDLAEKEAKRIEKRKEK